MIDQTAFQTFMNTSREALSILKQAGEDTEKAIKDLGTYQCEIKDTGVAERIVALAFMFLYKRREGVTIAAFVQEHSQKLDELELMFVRNLQLKAILDDSPEQQHIENRMNAIIGHARNAWTPDQIQLFIENHVDMHRLFFVRN